MNLRFTTFIIWPHGVPFLDRILDTLESKQRLRIIRIIKHKPKSIKKYIDFVYKYDKVNPIHMHFKTRYLKEQAGDIFVIVVGEVSPTLEIEGTGQDIIQSVLVSETKQEIRKSYNPRDEHGEMTHDHVLHATDQEDDALRVWSSLDFLFVDSISVLKNTMHGLVGMSRLFGGADNPLNLTSETIKFPLSSLKASIVVKDCVGNIQHKICNLDKTPHYHFLKLGKQDYAKYLQILRGDVHKCYYSEKKYSDLFKLMQNSIKLDNIIVKKIGTDHVIVDGLHRAVAALILGHKHIDGQLFDKSN